jgi:hypothetical protein
MSGISVKATAELLPSSIQEDGRRLFPFLTQLMALLTKHGIEPVILSGAPVEILRAHMESIASNNIIGLQLRCPLPGPAPPAWRRSCGMR